jgi:hypothetical protein
VGDKARLSETENAGFAATQSVMLLISLTHQAGHYVEDPLVLGVHPAMEIVAKTEGDRVVCFQIWFQGGSISHGA